MHSTPGTSPQGKADLAHPGRGAGALCSQGGGLSTVRGGAFTPWWLNSERQKRKEVNEPGPLNATAGRANSALPPNDTPNQAAHAPAQRRGPQATRARRRSVSQDAAGPQQNTTPVGPSLSESRGPNPHGNVSGCFSWDKNQARKILLFWLIYLSNHPMNLDSC